MDLFGDDGEDDAVSTTINGKFIWLFPPCSY
jgi:hypothetical protein